MKPTKYFHEKPESCIIKYRKQIKKKMCLYVCEEHNNIFVRFIAFKKIAFKNKDENIPQNTSRVFQIKNDDISFPLTQWITLTLVPVQNTIFENTMWPVHHLQPKDSIESLRINSLMR